MNERIREAIRRVTAAQVQEAFTDRREAVGICDECDRVVFSNDVSDYGGCKWCGGPIATRGYAPPPASR